MRTVNVGRVRLGPKPVKTLVSLEGATPKALCEKARELDSEPVDILGESIRFAIAPFPHSKRHSQSCVRQQVSPY